MKQLAVFLTATAAILLQTLFAAAAEPTAEQIEFFEKKIRPVFVKHCYECHSAKSKPPKGGLQLDVRAAVLKGGDSGAAIVPGKIKDSILIDALKYDGLEMPPKGKLPAAVISDFEKWIAMGAPDPRTGRTVRKSAVNYEQGLKFWAFKKPVKSTPPRLKSEIDIKNDIDRFIRARLEKHKLKHANPADRRTLIRRAYFDLIGLPPDPTAVDAFLQDSSDDAFEKVINQLLASEHYGERWGRYWLDIARYGEDQAHTFKARRYPRGYLYRDWVVQALNSDMPYDRFLKEQIAGDLLNEPNSHQRLAALGLFALGPVYYQDNGEKDKALADEWDDRVDTLMRGTQALTISCARCHDHKYDPISMADYYGLLGIFASSQYQERPVVPDSVVQSKRDAETAVKEHQTLIDRFLAEQSRTVRLQLVDQIPKYVVAAWKVINHQKSKRKDKKANARIAKTDGLSEQLVQRWVEYLRERPNSGATKSDRPYLDAWRKLIAGQNPKQNLTNDKTAIAATNAVGTEFQNFAQSLLPKRERLFKRFGDSLAFVKASDRAEVVPGIIPLGNLFDDALGTSLDSAISSDKFKATASSQSLGVDRVAQGWGHATQIANGIRFDFQSLGSDSRKYGEITNDGWSRSGGIRTTGKRGPANLPRTEQGIGMHANALITFDLNEIRRAGLIPADKAFVFHVDRAGYNDDVTNSGVSMHLAVVVSKPHSKTNVFDAIIAGYVNGRQLKVDENDTQYYFAGELPPVIKSDGKFVSFNIPVPPEAHYLTLVAAGAGKPDEENTISSDHSVFSGARLEFKPAVQAVAKTDTTNDSDGTATKQDLVEATFLSELFYDKGLLAIPPKDVEQYLKDDAANQLKAHKAKLAGLKKASANINVLMAHSLTEGQSRDLKIYLAGDPKKQGETAARSFPAIYTSGERQPFAPKGSGRLRLADAIASPDNPLTARVIVNRVWAGHFGYGLVRTHSNFGSLGERPTHPQLLDNLAVEFMESGWTLKSLHRKIMLSSTYQTSSEYNAANYEVDPDNRLLWRMNRRRLEVEPWRDAMLAVSDNLDPRLGGPSSNLADGHNKRRTMYGFISRHQLNDVLRLFDFPDPNITSGSRTSTTVPLQQLFVLNSDFMINQAKSLASRLNREMKSDEERINRAFLLLYSRPPANDEVELGRAFLSSERDSESKLSRLEQYAMALLGSNEFMFVD